MGAPLRFSQTAFPFAPVKRSENISDPQEVILSRTAITHTEGAFRPASAKDSHFTTQMASSAGGGFYNGRILKANGASLEAFRGLFKNHFRFIATDA